MERNQIPLTNILNKTAQIKPSMAFVAGDFSAWQAAARKKLEELLGLPFKKCEDLFETEFDTQNENYREIRFTFQSEDGYFVPCHLLIPSGATLPLPVVICLQGHSTGMHISLARPKFDGDEKDISNGDRDFASGAIKKGFCALTVEQRGFGECGGNRETGRTECYEHSMANLLIGRTTIGERVWDVSRAIDILKKHFSSIIDKENIICMGNSGGGTTTIYAAALDTRIKTAIPSCSFASFDDSIASIHHCSCNFVPNIRKYFDMGELTGLIAPRTLLIVSGKHDKIFPIASAKKEFETTKALYSNTDGSCRHIIGPEGHRFYYDLAWREFDEVSNKNIDKSAAQLYNLKL